MPNDTVPAAAPGLPISNRRGFLRGLTALPLIGGGVTLIGAPTAVAGEPSREAIETYLQWLHFEFSAVHDHLYPNGVRINGEYRAVIPYSATAHDFYFPRGWSKDDWPATKAAAAHRAPLVLSTVGCDWRGGDR